MKLPEQGACSSEQRTEHYLRSQDFAGVTVATLLNELMPPALALIRSRFCVEGGSGPQFSQLQSKCFGRSHFDTEIWGQTAQ